MNIWANSKNIMSNHSTHKKCQKTVQFKNIAATIPAASSLPATSVAAKPPNLMPLLENLGSESACISNS